MIKNDNRYFYGINPKKILMSYVALTGTRAMIHGYIY